MDEIEQDQIEEPREDREKCRAKFHDLSAEEQALVVKRCTGMGFVGDRAACLRFVAADEEFSATGFVRSAAQLQELWDSIDEAAGDPAATFVQIKRSMDFATFCSRMSDVRNILQRDAEMVAELATTHVQLADALKTIMRLAQYKPHVSDGGAMASALAQLLGGQAPARPAFQTPFTKLIRGDNDWCDQGKFEKTIKFNGQTLCVFVINWGGSQKCPFQSDRDKSYHGYAYGASDVVITNLGNGKKLRYSNLLPHMIKHHHFFEGPLCFYRVEPQSIIDVIGPLDPSKSYRLESYTKVGWAMSSAGNTHTAPTKFLRTVKLGRHEVFVLKEDKDSAPLEIKIIASGPEDAANDEAQLEPLGLAADDLPEGGGYVVLRRTAIKSRKYEDWLQDQPAAPATEAAVHRGTMGGGASMIKFGPNGEHVVTKLGEGGQGGECVLC